MDIYSGEKFGSLECTFPVEVKAKLCCLILTVIFFFKSILYAVCVVSHFLHLLLSVGDFAA